MPESGDPLSGTKETSVANNAREVWVPLWSSWRRDRGRCPMRGQERRAWPRQPSRRASGKSRVDYCPHFRTERGSEQVHLPARPVPLGDRSLPIRLGCFAANPGDRLGRGRRTGFVRRSDEPNANDDDQEFLQKKSSSGWIAVSDAGLNLLSAIHQTGLHPGRVVDPIPGTPFRFRGRHG
jgi:hypothetical protein